MTKPLPPDVPRKKGGRPPGSTQYPQDVIDKALLAMAYTRQSKAARRQLELAGIKPLPAEATLRLWKQKYARRLAELTEQYGADIDRHVAATYIDLVYTAQGATEEAIQKAMEAVEKAEDPRMITALSGAARNFATVYGISQEKALLVQGKATTIVGKEKDIEESLRSLADRFGVTDTTATEDKPKEIEE